MRRSVRVHLLALGLLAVLLGAACGGGTELELERAIDAARETNGTVDLAELADAEWDRVGIYGPGTSAAEIERTLGVAAPALAEDRLARDDGVSLLLFVRDGRVVAATYVPPDVAVFTESGLVLEPDEAELHAGFDDPSHDGVPRTILGR